MKLWEYLGSSASIKGIIGLEVETESLVPWTFTVEEHAAFDKHWAVKPDGSLRNFGQEFVFRQPLTFEGAAYKMAMKNFADLAKRVKFMKSPYSSVHVHLNMLHKEVVHVLNFICLYFLFEEVLTEYCGNTRNGNLFCLKTSNAELTYKTAKDLAKAIENGTGGHFIRNLNNGVLKYSALNLVPLRTFGSLEVRTHPGTDSVTDINRWIGILMQLFNKADTFLNPIDLVNRMNGYGTKTAFARFIFEDFTQYLDLTHLATKMEDGIWYATAVAAAVDNWKDFGNKKDTGKKFATKTVQTPALGTWASAFTTAGTPNTSAINAVIGDIINLAPTTDW